MRAVSFDSTLTNFKLIRKGEDVYWQLQLKAVESSSVRTITQQFKNDIDFNGAIDVPGKRQHKDPSAFRARGQVSRDPAPADSHPGM